MVVLMANSCVGLLIKIVAAGKSVVGEIPDVTG